MSRVLVPHFQLANVLYANSTVTIYTVSGGVKTAVQATLYAGLTGDTELGNPQTLDGDGKFQQAVYIDVPVICSVSGITNVADHDTGIVFTQGLYRGTWVTGTVYYPNDVIRDGANGDDTKDLYQIVSQHTSGTWATDKADATKMLISFDISLVAGALPTPDDPGDDGKILEASGGAGVWSALISTFMKTVTVAANAAAARGLLGALGSGDDGSVLTGLVAQGVHTISIPAGAFDPRTTNGAQSDLTELTTNDVMLRSYLFDAATEEAVQTIIPMPDSWDEGTLTAEILWTAASGSGDVVWGASLLSVGNDDAMDAAFGTEQTVTDTLITANDLHITAATSAIEPANTEAEGDVLFLQIARVAADGADTLAVDAKLIGVRLKYTIDAADDS